jgi:hypothetical protein
VAQVNIIGGQEREIQVSLDAIKMQGYGLSIPQVQQVFYHLTWTSYWQHSNAREKNLDSFSR